ncbi:MAG: HPr family phosphocarrier protein [Calditrichaeota bacterium]|nr:HPr family phosphocarrier protein [Calditrichota bacterium]
MKSAEVTITNRLGLHARPASKLVRTVTGGDSQVFLIKDGQRVNARSILGVMLLDAGQGASVCIEVSGADEDIMLRKLVELIVGKFGED